MSILTPAQCRAARALVTLSQPRLAQASGLGLSTVVDFERSRRKVSEQAAASLRGALETAGVVFIDADAQGPGVRLSRPDE